MKTHVQKPLQVSRIYLQDRVVLWGGMMEVGKGGGRVCGGWRLFTATEQTLLLYLQLHAEYLIVYNCELD